MCLKKIKRYISIFVIEINCLLSFSSCNNTATSDNGTVYQCEEVCGLKVFFPTPEDYTKELKEIRVLSPFFNNINIVLNDEIIYFSEKESRSYVSVFARDISEGRNKYKSLDDTSFFDFAVKSYFLENVDFSPKLPLLKKGYDNHGHPYCLAMCFSRYSYSDTNFTNMPVIEDNTLPMDSVEVDCSYYSIIDNTGLFVVYYSLKSINTFSFDKVMNDLMSIKIIPNNNR